LNPATPLPRIQFKAASPNEAKQGMPSQGDAQQTMPEQSDVGRETSSRGGANEEKALREGVMASRCKEPILRDPIVASGVAAMVVDLDPPTGDRGTEAGAELPSRQEASVIEVTPLSLAVPAGGFLVLTWKGGDKTSDMGIVESGRGVGGSSIHAHDDFAAAMESISPLVQEIVSQVDSAHEPPKGASPVGGEDVDGAQTSSLGKGEDVGEQSGAPTWWAAQGFLTTPALPCLLFFPEKPLYPPRRIGIPLKSGGSDISQ
jgi:hypothetical protein